MKKRIILAVMAALLGIGIGSADQQQPKPPARTVSVHQKHVYKPKPKPEPPKEDPAPTLPTVPTQAPKAPAPRPAPVATGRACIAPNGIEANVNQVRVSQGLPALCTHPGLRQAALNRANYMCSHNDFSHNGYDSQILAVYSPPSPGFVGENISAGLYPGGDAQVVQELVASPHHYENIVRPDYTEQGAASIMCSPPFYNFNQPVQVNVNDFGG
jgi:uncharacterized protein YkwD